MQEPSDMFVINPDPDEMHQIDAFIERLSDHKDINILDSDLDNNGAITFYITIEDRKHKLDIYPVELNIPSYIRSGHMFTEDEINIIDNTSETICVRVDFNGDPRQCYHDQIKIINIMFPNAVAVLDCAAEKLLSGKWLAHAAQSEILQAPHYLFTVQAVSGENGEVWLHSHGLRRCGFYELEILCSSQDMGKEHYQMIHTFASRMIEKGGIEPGEEVFLAHANEAYIVGTAVDWKEALAYYPHATIGTEADRDDGVHGDSSCVLMLYAGPDDCENGVYTTVQEFDDRLKQNPMFMYSNEETSRMRKLAVERVSYMVKAFENPEFTVLVKVGLTVDREYWSNDNEAEQKEHIWFELNDVKDSKITATLTQEPYYVSGINEGYVGTYPFSDITDWLALSETARITPDDVYLLD